MKISAWRAWAIGVGIVFIASLVSIVPVICNACFNISIFGRILAALWFLSQLMPAVAAFVVGYLAPHRKIILGTSMALPAAIFYSVINFMYQAFGHAVDFSGVAEGIILFIVLLITYGVYCGIGAALGAVGDYLVHPVEANGKKLEQSKNNAI